LLLFLLFPFFTAYDAGICITKVPTMSRSLGTLTCYLFSFIVFYPCPSTLLSIHAVPTSNTFRVDSTFIVIRPPDIVISGLMFYHDSSIYFCQLSSELTEQNSTKTGHMLASECDLKMHVQNLWYTHPLKLGCPKTIQFVDDLAT